MPHYTPAQRRALSGDPAFPELAPEPQGPPYTPETRALLALAARGSRIAAATAPDPRPAQRLRTAPPNDAATVAERVRVAPTPDAVLSVACAHYGASRVALLAGRRSDAVASARAVTAWELHRRGMSYPAIAEWMGMGSHGTALSAAKRVERRLAVAS